MIDLDYVNPAKFLGIETALYQILFNFLLALLLSCLVNKLALSNSSDSLSLSLHQAQSVSKQLDSLLSRKKWTERCRHLVFYSFLASLIVVAVREGCQRIQELQWLSSDLIFVGKQGYKVLIAVLACIWLVLILISKLLSNKIHCFNQKQLTVAKELLLHFPKDIKQQISNYLSPQRPTYCIRGCKAKLRTALAELSIYEELFNDLVSFSFCEICKGKANIVPLKEQQGMNEEERHLISLLNFSSSSCKSECTVNFWNFIRKREKIAERKLSELIAKQKSR